MHTAILRHLSMLIASSLLCFSGDAFANQSTKELLGKWQAVEVIGFAAVGALNQDAIDSLSGKIIYFDAHAVSFQQEKCEMPKYLRKRRASGSFLREYRIKLNPVHKLPKFVEEMSLQCTNISELQTFLIEPKGDLIFPYYGVLLKARRVE